MNAKLLKKQPRLASKSFVLRVDRFIEMYADKGLEQFQNLSDLEKLGLLKAARTGEGLPDPTDPPLPDDLKIPSLAICSDQEQVQITGAEFIFAPEPQGLGPPVRGPRAPGALGGFCFGCRCRQVSNEKKT